MTRKAVSILTCGVRADRSALIGRVWTLPRPPFAFIVDAVRGQWTINYNIDLLAVKCARFGSFGPAWRAAWVVRSKDPEGRGLVQRTCSEREFGLNLC